MNKIFLVLPLYVLLLAGCTSERAMVSATVNPTSPLESARPEGMLVVFSATSERVIGDGLAYHPHSSYVICNEQGVQVKYVANHVGDMDETPQNVGLPAGKYLVKAESERLGRVSVPVVIKPFRTTEVRLTGKAEQSLTASKGLDPVVLPNGTSVGWAGLR